MAEARGHVTKGRGRTTKTLAWRDADEACFAACVPKSPHASASS